MRWVGSRAGGEDGSRKGRSFDEERGTLAKSQITHGLERRHAMWLVETELASILEEQYVIGQTAGQIAARMLGEFSKNIFTKMKISRDPV